MTVREVMNWLRREGWAERPGEGLHVACLSRRSVRNTSPHIPPIGSAVSS